MKPYRDDVNINDIILDGWARGFNIKQTVTECHMMGYLMMTEEKVLEEWKRLDKEYQKYLEENP